MKTIPTVAELRERIKIVRDNQKRLVKPVEPKIEDILLPQYLQNPVDNNGGTRYYGDLDFDEDRELWVLKGQPQMVEMAKRLFPASESKISGVATFPHTARMIGDLNWFMIRYPLKINDIDRWSELLQQSQQHYQKQQIMLQKPQKELPGLNFKGELREFQKEGLAFLLHNPRSLLADEVGLGKTIMAIAWLTRINKKPPFLIVVPPHLLKQWTKEINRFLDTASVHIIQGLKPYSLPKADIYLVHYLILRGWKRELQDYVFNACIFDEIQELRHPTSEKYSVASLLASNISNVIGLSGNCFYNYGGEIWNILNILEYHCLGDYGSFSREWCYGFGGDKVSDPKRLGEYLREQGLFIRRLKEDVLSELPPKFRIVQEIDADNGLYDSLIGSAVNIAKSIDDKEGNFEKGRKMMEAIDETRRVTGIAKAGFVADFVKTLIEAGEPTVVFAHHHDVMDILMKELKDFNPVMISGRQNKEEKDIAQNLFMDGETNLIFVSLRSGTGLNLQRGRCAVFAELDWSPAVVSQCEGRLHRMGVRDSVLCYYLVCDRGTDQAMLETLGAKKSQFVNIMGDPVETEQELIEAETEIKKHMASVIDILRQGGKPKVEPTPEALKLIKKIEPKLEKKHSDTFCVPEIKDASGYESN